MVLMTFSEWGFRRRFSVESLCDVFESEVRKKSTVGIDRVTVKSFARDLQANVEIISRKVFEGSYHFTNYSQMLVPKAPGAVPRELCIPTVRDKVTLKALSHVLDDAFGSSAATAWTLLPLLRLDSVVPANKNACKAYRRVCRFRIGWQISI